MACFSAFKSKLFTSKNARFCQTRIELHKKLDQLPDIPWCSVYLEHIQVLLCKHRMMHTNNDSIFKTYITKKQYIKAEQFSISLSFCECKAHKNVLSDQRKWNT